jgi:hypothetical protein
MRQIPSCAPNHSEPSGECVMNDMLPLTQFCHATTSHLPLGKRERVQGCRGRANRCCRPLDRVFPQAVQSCETVYLRAGECSSPSRRRTKDRLWPSAEGVSRASAEDPMSYSGVPNACRQSDRCQWTLHPKEIHRGFVQTQTRFRRSFGSRGSSLKRIAVRMRTRENVYGRFKRTLYASSNRTAKPEASCHNGSPHSIALGAA